MTIIPSRIVQKRDIVNGSSGWEADIGY